jgi:uroporphyrinogen-III synthase
MAYTHRRARPSYSPQEVTWQPDDVALSINLSLESLQNLRTILGEIHRLKLLEKPLLVVSEAMKEAAQQLGFSGAIIVAADATESSLINEVSRIFKI